MIGVVEQDAKPLENFATEKELYLALREEIGKLVSIRRQIADRSGVLERIKYNRESKKVTFSFGSGEMLDVNRLHHIEVRIDGIWKVINPGTKINQEL